MRRLLGALLIPWLACSDDAPVDDGATSSVGGTSASSVVVTVASTASGGVDLPPEFTIDGVVVDEDGAPVADAIVLQGGRTDEPTETSAADGTFTLTMRYEGMGVPAVVATKTGYRTAGVEFYALPDEAVTLTLYSVNPPDNTDYLYGEPGDGNGPSTAYCGHCHNTFADQFTASKHKQATKNPLVQDTYAGVTQAFTTQASCTAAGGSWKVGLVPGTSADTTNKCYLGGGVLPDLNTGCGGPSQPACDHPASTPSAFGACADCHAPGIEGVAGGRNLHDAVGIAFDNGVHCDPCHKVSFVDPTQPAGVGGKLVVQRPIERVGLNPRQVMFGPLLDVPNSFMGGSYQPQFAEAVFCSGCHEQLQPALIPGQSLNATRWPDGLPVHSTYSEWLSGPFAA
ncbi:MAG TPA: carboxypeptidase-like regulatory domain-containing protein, partial [Polyangiaceae bacterium]|nr:carboxypeptidase-like regulatory domain-containing protein [Polyangiaceae bacterium]